MSSLTLDKAVFTSTVKKSTIKNGTFFTASVKGISDTHFYIWNNAVLCFPSFSYHHDPDMKFDNFCECDVTMEFKPVH